MSIVDLYTDTAVISRLTATAGIRSTYQSVATGVACLIQPLDAMATQQAGMAFGKGFKMYVELVVDLREGDRVVDQAGTIYFVKGVQTRTYGGSLAHRKAFIEMDKKR